jgi:dihydrofolate synthase/folylpolyglutamate synthase
LKKAGIIKPNIPIIIGEYTLTKPECNFAADLISETYSSDLIGDS